MPTLNFKSGLSDAQRSSITNLLSTGRVLNETDARNLAYATGTGNWQQFLNKGASNFSIGNLSQFVAPAATNTNPANGSAAQLPNLGQSNMGAFFNDKTTTGLTSMEQSIMSYADQQQKLNEEKKLAAQNQYDQAYAGMESAYNQPSGLELMKTLMAEQGIQDKQNQLSEFQKQLANLQNEFTNANNAIGSQPINTAIIRGQQYQKQLEFASKATLIQSQAAVVEGQLNFAKDLVQGYYDAATTDRQNQISRYQTLLKLADDKLVNLAADEKDNLNMMISTLKDAETRQQENKDKIAALMLDPIASIAWSKTPGLSLTDDYSTIVNKLLPQMAAERLRQFGIMHPGKTSGTGLGNAVTGLGITGKNLKTDIDTLAQQFAAMGTQLSDSQYRQAVYALIDTYKFDTTMGEGSDYNMISSDLNNAIAKYRTDINQPTPTTPTVSSTTPSKTGIDNAYKDVYNPLLYPNMGARYLGNKLGDAFIGLGKWSGLKK